MLDFIFHKIESLATELESDVAQRRTITTHDPVADARAFDATQLRKLVGDMKSETEELTAAQYATLHRTTAQTVSEWCSKQKIPARRGARNAWLIPRSALPPRRRATPASKRDQ